MNWQQRAARAARLALRLRVQLGYGPSDAACPIDICLRLEIDTWFQAHPSLEGLYMPGEPSVVVINSLRPAGRRRYTAGHELGHDAHGHGASLDAQLNDESKVDEFVANRFSRELLMPQLAVAHAYSRRGWEPRQSSPCQVFVVAQDLGVGYTALLEHMTQTLRLLDRGTADRLGRIALPKLRAELVGNAIQHDVFPIDRYWGVRPLDVEVGDLITMPAGSTFEGASLEADSQLLRAACAGSAVLAVPGRKSTITVRISRRGFVGRACYRHLEEPDES